VSTRTYPLPSPGDEDPRFTFGLTSDIGRLLEAAGYPPITGADHVQLQLALFRFLYAPEAVHPTANATAIERPSGSESS
jgi:hypothetical protein